MGSSLSRRAAGRLGWDALRALNRAGVLTRSGLTAEVTVEGRAVNVPLWSGVGLDHGEIPDRHLLPVLSALLDLRTGAFVDVGAHVGQTLVKLLVLGDPRPYLGFEPKPRAAAYVQALLDANGRDADTVVAAAAGDAAGIGALASAGDLDDSASLVDGPAPREARPVPVVRGDDALAIAGIDGVGVLKIDAEGTELEVVRGFEATIAREKPAILCEILPFGPPGDPEADRRAARAAELERILGERDYATLACGRDGRVTEVESAAPDRSFEDREFAFVQRAELGELGQVLTRSRAG